MSDRRYPQRKSPRLQGYDYSQSGAYFITICTNKWAHWFGDIRDGVMVLHAIGQIAADCWAAIPAHFTGVELDLAVVMPNHIHGIIVLEGGGAALGTIIGSYKAAVTRQVHRQQLTAPKTIWHTRYYDHIIRNELALNHIREYILSNPTRWQMDRLYTM
jgi:REP element-mobilizing transposase RayT